MSINKIKGIEEFKLGITPYEVIIKDEKGKVVYQAQSVGGILVSVEKIFDVSNGEISGQQQIFGWGNIIAQWYGYDQVRKYFRQNMERFIDEVVKIGGIKGSPETIEELKKMFREKTQ